MLGFLIPEHRCEVPKNVALIDTNVLIAYHNFKDRFHEQARLFLKLAAAMNCLFPLP
jgi:hypothetical protein